MTPTQYQQYSRTLELLLEAALNPAVWGDALQSLTELTQHQFGSLLLFEKESTKIITGSLFWDESIFTSYKENYSYFDPAVPIMNNYALGEIYQDRLVLGDRFIKSSKYYNEFQRESGMNNVTCVKLGFSENYNSFLSLITSYDANYPDAMAFTLLRKILPSLVTVAALNSRFELLREGLKNMGSLLDGNIYPVWLVNNSLRIMYANNNAKLFSENNKNPWAINSGFLSLDVDHHKFQHIIQNATQLDSRPKAGITYLNRTTSTPVFVTPARHLPGVACVIIPISFVSDTPLIDMFGLTLSENKLAMLLVQGFTPDECAEHLNITIATVRTHLRSLFRKTKTTNQQELLILTRAVH